MYSVKPVVMVLLECMGRLDLCSVDKPFQKVSIVEG